MLEAAGSSIDNCVQVKIFLTDMVNFAAMNKVYAEVFHKEPKPVRTWYVPPPPLHFPFPIPSHSLPRLRGKILDDCAFWGSFLIGRGDVNVGLSFIVLRFISCPLERMLRLKLSRTSKVFYASNLWLGEMAKLINVGVMGP